MVELWFYSGRLGNCMFMHAFTRIVGDSLGVKTQLPKGTEITEFPLIAQDSINVPEHDGKYEIGDGPINDRTCQNENDNMAWLIEKTFSGGKIESYEDQVSIQKVLGHPNICNMWSVLLGNFELGENYTPYRNKLRKWFTFPTVDMKDFEFFKLHPRADGIDEFFVHHDPFQLGDAVTPDDLVISLRLEDYTNDENLDRLLDFEYFRIILESRKFNRVYIITNPGSIGHGTQFKYLLAFKEYDPIIVRVYKPVASMAFAASFDNIAISQSTYSWWIAFLSHARNVYYPLPIKGPFSLTDEKFCNCDLRVACRGWLYVDEATRTIMPEASYRKIDYPNYSWKP